MKFFILFIFFVAQWARAEKISIGIFLTDIQEIKDVEETVTVDFATRIFWEDRGLLKKFKDKNEIPSDGVMIPSFVILNEKELKRSLGEVIRKEPNGRVSILFRYSGKIANRADYSNFPFDHQTFTIKILFLKKSYQLEHLKEISSIAQQFSIFGWAFSNDRIDLVNYEGSKKYPFNFPMVEVKIDGQRKIGYYLWKIYLPIALIVLIAWSAFWLEIPMMEPRVNIAITANLTLIAYLFVLAEMIPQISYLSKIDFFIIGSLILVFLSFWGVILTFIANKKSTKLGNSIQVFFRLLHPCFFILSLIYQFSRM